MLHIESQYMPIIVLSYAGINLVRSKNFIFLDNILYYLVATPSTMKPATSNLKPNRINNYEKLSRFLLMQRVAFLLALIIFA